MEERVFDVPQELNDAIQSRQIKLESLNEMIAFCLSDNTNYKVPMEKLDILRSDYYMFKEEYEALKKEVEDLVKSKMPEGEDFDYWNLDFATCKVTVQLVK